MNFFERRRLRKAVHHLLHEARHARHMREDIASPESIQRIRTGEAELKRAWRAESPSLVDKTADELAAAIHAVYPPRKHPRLRENVEIMVVAIAVAMAFRTFFIQPFRIPTGSMQPTLNGITFTPTNDKGIMHRFPLSIASFILFGERYVEVRAKASGPVAFREEYSDDSYIIRVAGVPHLINKDIPRQFQLGQEVQRGDILASGIRQLGDHIFVNRVKYNFMKPQRGDVFVFNTKEINHPDIRPDNFYIKRLVGLPGETISIDPPYLLANGTRVTEPEAFRRQAGGEGYDGYTLVNETPLRAILRHPGDKLPLSDKEYLPFGDNTKASLDGRFFGGVNQHSIIGPAFMVYWPFTKRWGFIN